MLMAQILYRAPQKTNCLRLAVTGYARPYPIWLLLLPSAVSFNKRTGYLSCQIFGGSFEG
jgi:hypothetical protein